MSVERLADGLAAACACCRGRHWEFSRRVKERVKAGLADLLLRRVFECAAYDWRGCVTVRLLG